MILPGDSVERSTNESGFTLVEILVAVAVSGVVMTAVYQMLLGQGSLYTKQRELMDVHESVRTSAALLAWDLRQASAADGDLYSIDANAVVLRSAQGMGIVCSKHPTQPRYGLWATGGNIAATADDSALVFAAGGNDWKMLKIQQTGTPASLGVGVCEWAGGGIPDLGVELVVGSASDTAGIEVGAPFRAFRRVEYRLYEETGRWWLGRRVGAAASYEKLAGPFLSQASGGLTFTYYDASANPTPDPTQVEVVEFVLRAESYRRQTGGSRDFQRDTLATRVALRG